MSSSERTDLVVAALKNKTCAASPPRRAANLYVAGCRSGNAAMIRLEVGRSVFTHFPIPLPCSIECHAFHPLLMLQHPKPCRPWVRGEQVLRFPSATARLRCRPGEFGAVLKPYRYALHPKVLLNPSRVYLKRRKFREKARAHRGTPKRETGESRP